VRVVRSHIEVRDDVGLGDEDDPPQRTDVVALTDDVGTESQLKDFCH